MLLERVSKAETILEGRSVSDPVKIRLPASFVAPQNESDT